MQRMSILEHTPQFTEKEAISMTRNLFGMEATATLLPSERDQNFLMGKKSGERFVLKIANAMDQRERLDCQNRAMMRIAETTDVCPAVVPNLEGRRITPFDTSGGITHFIRLVSYLEGTPLGRIKRQTDDLRFDLGRRLGQLDRALAGFDHPGAHRDAFKWNLAGGISVVERYAPLIADGKIRKQVEQLMAVFENTTAPVLSDLRKSVIHNDANDYNVIIGNGEDLYSRNQRIVGIIDFGDMVHSYTVGDPAIAIAYAVLNRADPVAVASRILAGYHSEYPLEEKEISALFGLVCLRLCMSASIAAHQQQQRPDNAYLSISQEPIRNTLPVLTRIHPRFAEAVFRNACGYSPLPRSATVCRWLKDNRERIDPISETDLATEPCRVVDLGMESPLVAGDAHGESLPGIAARVAGILKASGTRIGIGGYDETRLPGVAELLSGNTEKTDGAGRVHIGRDLFFNRANASVYAPMAGRIHRIEKQTIPGYSGSALLFEHITDRGDTFYTLFKHLTAASTDHFITGQFVEKGRKIGIAATRGRTGAMSHLHFQLIVDLLDLGTGFPNHVPYSEREIWKSFSPDPNLILGIPEQQLPVPTPDKRETLAFRCRHMGRNLSIGYRNPVKIVRGWMQYLFDETGRRYLDAYNNVPHVGHCHPRVVQSAVNQMKVLNTNTRYLHDRVNRYAERLLSTVPDPLSVCYFVNSASEGNELALRLARAYTGRREMIVLEAAYHGNTTSLIDISPYKHDGPGGAGRPAWVHTAPIADLYRGPYKADDPDAGFKYAEAVGDIADCIFKISGGLAAFISETCPSVGGQIIFPEGYLQAAYRHVRKAGGVCIADEVQTGYGRIGTHFYAFEAQGVVPDIVVLGKPIGNGHPVGAVITTAAIAEAFDNGMEFFSTFGGNTVTCAVGLTVLDVVFEEGLQENARLVGHRLMRGLMPMKRKFPLVGDVRGAGFFVGVELVRNTDTLEPAGEEAAFIVDRMRDHGILVGIDGPFHNVIKIRPPMTFSGKDADHLATTLNGILAKEFYG